VRTFDHILGSLYHIQFISSLVLLIFFCKPVAEKHWNRLVGWVIIGKASVLCNSS